MPQGDISSEEGVGEGGRSFPRTKYITGTYIFKSIFTLGLFASFCLPVISDAFTSFPETCILKTKDPRFDSIDQGRLSYFFNTHFLLLYCIVC